MRQVLLLCLWMIVWTPATSQVLRDSLRYDTMPTNGIVLDQGWTFHAGDNLDWASPTFDDRGWQSFSPTTPPGKLPQLKSTHMGWARLHFRLSKRIRQQALFLIEDQFLASEIYLNGKLIHRYGTVSNRPERVQLAKLDYFNALELPIDSSARQVLAIRFVSWPPLSHVNNYLVPYFFKFILVGKPELLARFAEWIPLPVMYAVLTGIFLLLAMLHLAFWKYNPDRRANVYFAGYAFIESLAFGIALALWHEVAISTYLGLSILMFLLVQLGNLQVVKALYTLFDFRTGKMYYFLWVAFFVAQLLFLTLPDGFWPFGSFMLLVLFEQVRLTMLALQQHKRGTRLIATGFALSLLTMTAIVGLNYAGLLTYSLYLFVGLGFVIGAPAVGISLFLAREFALDSQLLQVKLRQVRDLSARTIAQEQEKQQLLAKQNETLEQQVAERTAQLQQFLNHLKATQEQLVQKEKMASLGELTAGIAHEIQNPLNFVNNFSDVSAELIEELEEEHQKSQPDATVEAQLLADLKTNFQRIHHHGKRASSIVRGMLEHSRNSTGTTQPTDLNALCDEYLSLAYHGQRAKLAGFSCQISTNFDPTLTKVEVMTQEMGRVLLNLFNNAFYAVRERQQWVECGYQPSITVSTIKTPTGVEIRIGDNGIGMSQAVQKKIFQPFFTTKPTGEGTGLGLSLSYDIITKGHSGSLSVLSQEGKGSQFIIYLPVASADG